METVEGAATADEEGAVVTLGEGAEAEGVGLNTSYSILDDQSNFLTDGERLRGQKCRYH